MRDARLATHYTMFPTEYEDCLLPATTGAETDPLTLVMHERPMIYVAGYYSANPTHGVVNAVKGYDALRALGWCPVVPHISILLDMLSPNTPEYWYAYDFALLKRCDAMFVCPDEKTAGSTGVADEIVFCNRYDIPVVYELVAARDWINR